MNLQGKLAAVTGAAMGMGKCVSRMLLEAGCRVALIDVNQEALVVTAKGWKAQYRPDGKKEFLTAAEGKLPPPGKDEVSIQCYNGPPEGEHWIRFDDFRIEKLAE